MLKLFSLYINPLHKYTKRYLGNPFYSNSGKTYGFAPVVVAIYEVVFVCRLTLGGEFHTIVDNLNISN